MIDHTTVIDPTIRQPGCNLPHHTWSLMNHFQTGQGPCCVSPNHRPVINTCPLTKFEGGLNLLHKADDDAIIRLESTVAAALAK